MPDTQRRERPIIFSAPMVRAILEGRKTQTRRIIKRTKMPECDTLMRRPEACKEGVEFFMDMAYPTGPHLMCCCPFGSPGDRLWVRETWQQIADLGEGHLCTVEIPSPANDWTVFYAATHTDSQPPRWRSPIHMPRWASRITLEVEGVRAERVREISVTDVAAEDLWDSIHGPGAWKRNDWVWVITFRRIT